MNKFWMILITTGLLAGCAGRGPIVDHTEVYMRHAGDEVTRVRYDRVRNWRPVGREMIMMDFGARGQYLFELSPECHSRFHTGLSLKLDNYQHRVIDISDRIIFDDIHRCRIVSMRSVDMRAVREELAELDEADVGQVESGEPEENH